MGFQNIKEFVDAELNGQTWYSTWRKTPTQVTAAGIWFDLSMSPGNPVPNYYAASPNISVALAQSTDGGIWHGANVSPMNKFIKRFTVINTTAAPSPARFILCDYLLFYPFVDMGITDLQPMINTVSLPRYTDGIGNQIMVVEVAGQSGAGNPQFNITYTNENDETRITPTVACNTQIVSGTIITTAVATFRCAGPFMPLQGRDRGVKNIQSIQFMSPDFGLVALVIVHVLDDISILASTTQAPAEDTPFLDFSTLSEIKDDAYLNLICCPNGTLLSAPLHGDLQTIWN